MIQNPDIYKDDQLICNDPYTAAIHGPDVALVAPIIYRGQLIGFAAAASHQMDIGGRDPGGIMVRPEQCYEEGLQIPAMKIIEKGQWRKEWEGCLNTLKATEVEGMLVYSCRKCGHVLGPAKEDYKNFASKRTVPISKAQPGFLASYAVRSDTFVMREYFCPSCGWHERASHRSIVLS